MTVGPIRVARLDGLPAGRPSLVEANGVRIVLTRVKDEVYACDDACAHKGGPLSEGKLSGYPVRVDAGEIWVEVP